MFGMKATPGEKGREISRDQCAESSVFPLGAPLFSQGSRRETPKGGAFGINRLKAQAASEKKKANSNSTNSYYISETPTAPDEKELTLCAAKAIALLIEAGKNKNQTPPAARLPGQKEPREMIFDERAHCLKSTLKKGLPTEGKKRSCCLCVCLFLTIAKRGHFQVLAHHLQEDAHAARVHCDDRVLH
jgi:hypothetical protein